MLRAFSPVISLKHGLIVLNSSLVGLVGLS